jgi:hypothetical protein
MPLTDLLGRMNPDNVKLHADDDIRQSMSRFGYIEPVTLDERTGRLVSGHGRVENLEVRRVGGESPPDGIVTNGDGKWMVPVGRGWSSRSDDEARAAMVAINFLVPRGGWDNERLARQLDELRNGPGLDGIGVSSSEVDRMLAELAVPDFSPADIGDQHRLDRTRFHLVCNNCGSPVDPATASRIDVDRTP